MASETPSSRGSSPDSERSHGGEDRDRSESQAGEDKGDHPPRKRQRVRLSCLECRRRKLSCDRGFPCERCIKSGTPERCTYETRPGLAPPAKNGLSQGALANFESRISALTGGLGSGPLGPGGGMGGAGAGGSYMSDAGIVPPYRRDSHRSGSGPSALVDGDRMRRLELEVAQLKQLLASAAGMAANNANPLQKLLAPSDGSATLHDDDSPLDKDGGRAPSPPTTFVETIYGSSGAAAMQVGDELRFFRGKEFKTRYFGPHNACMAFSELTGLCPFMKETAEEWLRPLHVHHHHSKDRQKRKKDREERFNQPDPELESLLPERAEMDVLINIYLDQFEQVHRIVHIPSFRRDYAAYWEPGNLHTPAFTALLLSMMSISSCLRGNPTGKFVGMVSQSHHLAERWINACDAWSQRQSQKHRKLVHYQIACLNYLAKRVNTMKKKRFWKTSGALTQDAVSVGLHREPSHIHDSVSVYNQEMRRRIWATIQEFDMQASFDHGLPTLLSALRFDVHPPRNLADEDFDEDTTELPQSRPTDEYTFSSYQHLSRQSLPLRLQLSRVLTGPPDDLDYDQVIRYTNDITQEIDALPSWDVRAITAAAAASGGEDGENGENVDAAGTPGVGCSTATKLTPLLAYTLLHIQLRQYIIPLHQPYLKLRKTNSKYQYSEIIYYNAARDMVLLHDKLAEQGVRTLNFLREDALTLSINLCSVTMLQSRGSTNMIMVNSQHTKKLLEKCLAMKEDRVLRCGNNEPWGYSIMCAATGLLEAHLGDKTPEAAKASSAERFVNLHCKLLARQEWQTGAGDGVAASVPAIEDGNSQQEDSSRQALQQQQTQAQVQAQAQQPQQPLQLTQPQQPRQPPRQALQSPQQRRMPPPHMQQVQALRQQQMLHQQQQQQQAKLGPLSVPDLSKHITPFLPMTQPGTTPGVVDAAMPAPPAAWWMSNIANMSSIANPNADPTIQAAQQVVNPDFNYELLGLNLGDLWADYSWEDV
ncbi:hypothetical protein SCUCBS95973_009778 [Sporothrix curviconia]|uniref:Zn(2)-C6 fungal-type domain-containing protein n=1 Tax=Sporothrix curviconia TaxID=1260050 RepID=A0ABP0CXR7_9PEZI